MVGSLESYLEKLKDPTFENNVPYMYVDSVEKITIGVGHNITAHGGHADLVRYLFSVKRAARTAMDGDVGMPVTNFARNRPASKEEKEADYDFLIRHRKSLKHYAAAGQVHKSKRHVHKTSGQMPFTTVELDSTTIDAIFATDIVDATHRAAQAIPAFKSLPVPCQATLIDIAFNAGSLHHYKPLRDALNGLGVHAQQTLRERLTFAAAHVASKTGNITRNQVRAQWMLEAARLADAGDWNMPIRGSVWG